MNEELRHLEAILPRVQKIAQDTVRLHAGRVDRDATWPEEGLRALQAAGLGGLVVSRKYGGNGQGLHGLARVSETLGRECASTAICFGMHCVGASVIAAQVTDDQADAFLRPICEGRHLTTLALSEPGTGAHFYFPQTRARLEADGSYRLSGEKTFVTNGGHADSYVISAAGAGAGPHSEVFSCFIVPATLDGLEWGDDWQGFGMRGNRSTSLRLDGVRVPAGSILGVEGDQIWYVFNVVAPYFLIAMAGTYLGVAAAALDEAIGHARVRQHGHSGARLAQSPVIQHKIGELAGMLEQVRRLTYHAAATFDAGLDDAPVLVMMAKAQVADIAVTIVNEAMTILGGIGYRDDAKIQRCLRDVRASHVMAPTTDLLKIWVGRSLLDEPLLGD